MPMYNLLVTGNVDNWHGEPWEIELSRCVREYIETDLTDRFGSLDQEMVLALKRLPCIFAYESTHHLPPKFGRLTEIIRRERMVRIEYQFDPVEPFLTDKDLLSLKFELAIGEWEMNRSHWAVKEVNLPRELLKRGINLPGWTQRGRVNILSHQFDVALSFPGEERELVRQVVAELESILGPDRCFYDRNYAGQLARPGMDVLLQSIYRDRAKLVVVFISGHYQLKDWCGVEFRAIRNIINRRDLDQVMYIRTGDGAVDGVLSNDGYVDARHHSPRELADFIEERLSFLPD